MICRRCGTVLPAGALFCHCCALTGEQLHWAAAAPTAERLPRGAQPPAAPRAVIVLEEDELVVPA
jgi:hypothetical protein